MAWGPFLRRRWRLVGFIVVLLAGTALFSVLTDRGHDARWDREVPGAEVVAVAPDASRVYVLTKENGTLRQLVAYSRGGDRVWSVDLAPGSPGAVLEASEGLVAVATTASVGGTGARLLVLNATDGAPRLDAALPFSARALAIGPSLLAVAVQVPSEGYPVLLWKDLAPAGRLSWNESVESLDVENGVLAAGTAKGRVVVLDPDGSEVVNTSRGYQILQVRLDERGRFLAAAGREFAAAGGRVEFYRLRDPAPEVPRWNNLTRAEVPYIDLNRDGSRVLALASPPGSSELTVFDTAQGADSPWPTLRAGGVIHRQGTSTAAGARISPDGRHVAFGTLTGGIAVYEYGAAARLLWRHDALGTTSLAFPATQGSILAGDASYSPPRGTDRLLLFDLHEEPFRRDLARFVPAALLTEGLLGAGVLAVEYLRRPRVGARPPPSS